MAAPEKIIRIDALFADLFKKRQWDKRLALHAVFRNWPQVVGPEIAERTAPQVIRGTVLWIAVSDSVWMQQLHLQKQALLEQINANVRGSEKISDIRFQIDAVLRRKGHIVGKEPATKIRWKRQGTATRVGKRSQRGIGKQVWGFVESG